MKNLDTVLFELATRVHRDNQTEYGRGIWYPKSFFLALELAYGIKYEIIEKTYNEMYQEIATDAIFVVDAKRLSAFKIELTESIINKDLDDQINASELKRCITYHFGGVKYWPRSRQDHTKFSIQILEPAAAHLSDMDCNTSAIWGIFKAITKIKE